MLNNIESKVKINPNEPVIVLSGHNWHGELWNYCCKLREI